MPKSAPPDEHFRGSTYAGLAVGAGLSVLFYLHLLLRIDPRLIHHQQRPAFLTGWAFLRTFLDRPGGLVEYVTAFMTELCQNRWLGAAAITLAALLICLATRALLAAMAGRRVHPWATVFPAVVLLMLYGRYSYSLAPCVALLVALGAAAAYAWLARGPILARLPALMVLWAVVFWVAGGAVMLTMLLCCLLELLRRRSIVLGAAALLLGAAGPYLFCLASFEIAAPRAYLGWLPFRTGVVASLSTLELWPGVVALFSALRDFSPALLGLIAFVPVASVVAALGSVLARRASGDGPRPADAAWTCRSLGALLIIVVPAVALSLDSPSRSRLRVAYYVQHEMWSRVLDEARTLPRDYHDSYVSTDVNLALYHTGKLPTEMFAFAQPPAARSGWKSQEKHTGSTRFADLMFQMGQINRAEHKAHQALELHGPQPATLKRLARINIIKDRPDAARIFLRLMRRSLFDAAWADEYLLALDGDPKTAGDPLLRRLRDMTPTKDAIYYIIGKTPPEDLLRDLLDSNKRNRMAFEYLMALYLLGKRNEAIYYNICVLDRLADFDYEGIPRHYEEALLLYAKRRGNRALDLHGRKISEETLQKFERFRSVLMSGRGNQDGSFLRDIAAEFGGTYFFYHEIGSALRVGPDGHPLPSGGKR